MEPGMAGELGLSIPRARDGRWVCFGGFCGHRSVPSSTSPRAWQDRATSLSSGRGHTLHPDKSQNHGMVCAGRVPKAHPQAGTLPLGCPPVPDFGLSRVPGCSGTFRAWPGLHGLPGSHREQPQSRWIHPRAPSLPRDAAPEAPGAGTAAGALLPFCHLPSKRWSSAARGC